MKVSRICGRVRPSPLDSNRRATVSQFLPHSAGRSKLAAISNSLIKKSLRSWSHKFFVAFTPKTVTIDAT